MNWNLSEQEIATIRQSFGEAQRAYWEAAAERENRRQQMLAQYDGNYNYLTSNTTWYLPNSEEPTLLVPPELADAARRVLNSNWVTGSATEATTIQDPNWKDLI